MDRTIPRGLRQPSHVSGRVWKYARVAGTLRNPILRIFKGMLFRSGAPAGFRKEKYKRYTDLRSVLTAGFVRIAWAIMAIVPRGCLRVQAIARRRNGGLGRSSCCSFLSRLSRPFSSLPSCLASCPLLFRFPFFTVRSAAGSLLVQKFTQTAVLVEQQEDLAAFLIRHNQLPVQCL
ncbi:MAG TPA: hypothetical protein VMB03_19370 [Bryobacteraceae bacterium]|nr:hypothetical protein [Bryobacteraceae bacterium]